MRQEVRALLELGPMPSEHGATIEQVNAYGELIERLTKPVSDDEARALIQILPQGQSSSYFGLAWAVLHLIESAPRWPLMDSMQGDTEWILRLRERMANAS